MSSKVFKAPRRIEDENIPTIPHEKKNDTHVFHALDEKSLTFQEGKFSVYSTISFTKRELLFWHRKSQ